MTDLNPLLIARARTGQFHGQSTAEEQAYFEAFSDAGTAPDFTDLRHSIAAAAQALRAVFGRLAVRRARLS